MSKRNFIALAAFAALVAILIPVWALSREGESSSPARVASSDEKAKALFETNCGTCHSLTHAGSDGVVGPNLDQSDIAKSGSEAVLGFIENGSGGVMPAGILQGANAELVADFVGRVAGE